jgi:osmotically-inducible protein OsmY
VTELTLNFLETKKMLQLRLVSLLVLILPFMLQGCAGPAIVSASVGATMVHDDPRTAGTIFDDRVIVSKLSTRIKDKYSEQVNVTVSAYNNVVLLTGQVPNQKIKDDLGLMTLETRPVRDFRDETAIRDLATLKETGKDIALKGKVVSQLARNKDVRSVRIKTTVELGVVYLMGLVTREEGETAGQIVASVGGVEKVVKIFEYVD